MHRGWIPGARALGWLRPTGALVALALLSGCGAADQDWSGDDAEQLGQTSETLGAGSYQEVTGFGSNPGALKMFRYVPSPAPAPGAPLVVAMHACSQDAATYRTAGFEEVADENGFYVLYPEQQTGNNALKCFNWAGEYGDTSNLQRGKGENESIVEMVLKMQQDFDIDSNRVFIMGHSGGGAQTAVMMATWPDVFAGAGIIAGIPFHCTTSTFQVSTCLSPGIDKTPMTHGDLVRQAYPGYSGPYPRLSIWQGTGDTLVKPMNANELLEQWSNVMGIDTNADVDDVVDGANHKVFKDSSGNSQIELYEIPGAGHGTFVDPSSNCGATSQYMLDEGICAARRMAEFWGITASSGNGGSGGSSSNGGSSASGGSSSNGGSSASGGSSSNGGASASGGSGGSSSSGGNSGSGGACIPGQQLACACGGGLTGVQVCSPSGLGLGPCDCSGSPTSGGSSGSSSQGGATSSNGGSNGDPADTSASGACEASIVGNHGSRGGSLAMLGMALGMLIRRRRKVSAHNASSTSN